MPCYWTTQNSVAERYKFRRNARTFLAWVGEEEGEEVASVVGVGVVSGEAMATVGVEGDFVDVEEVGEEEEAEEDGADEDITTTITTITIAATTIDLELPFTIHRPLIQSKNSEILPQLPTILWFGLLLRDAATANSI